MNLRPATLEDAAILLDWANDPAVRAASFNTAPIDAVDHVKWLTHRLPKGGFYIAENDGHPVGYARVDRTGEIAASIDAKHRRQGLGRELIMAAATRARGELGLVEVWARVKADNPESLAAFMAAGFAPIGTVVLRQVPRAA